MWKLEGLSEYQLRRPMTPTGTNLLGLVKHLASVELGYFGDCLGRPSGIELPWDAEDSEPNADMWATADESSEFIVGLYRQAWAHADASFAALDLDAPAQVPWWGEKGNTSLNVLLVHMIAETHRHAGHADIVREMIDGAVGLRQGNTNLPPVEPEYWQAYRERLEAVALAAGG
ncbi:MAG: DinB family protein [Micropruina sp.]|nr:DinB family protein [Micropruina sp.]